MSDIKYQDITDSISQIKAEQLDENVDIGDITRQALMFGAGNPAVEKYGKYLVPAVGGGLALAALNKKPKKRTFGSFLKSAALAGLGATAAELGKRELMLRNPDVLQSPYIRPATKVPYVGEPGFYFEQDNTGAEANQLNEDGHTDVPSSMRMCMTIMEDAHDILCALKNTEMDEEIDTWWTNKLAVSASTLNKLRDYYVHEVDHEEQPDEADMEIEEAKTDKAMGGSAGMGVPVRRGTARDVGIATGVLGGLGASALTNAHIRRRTGMQEANDELEEQRGLPQPVRGRNPSGVRFPTAAGQRVPRGSAAGAVSAPLRGTGPAVHNTPKGGTSDVNPFRGFPVGKALRRGSYVGLGTGAAAADVYLMNLVSKANKNPKRRSGIQEE